MTQRDDQIRAEEARVAALARALAEAQAQLDALRAQDARARRLLPLAEDATAPTRPSRSRVAEKIALFRRLFRGRDDVYPKFWRNASRGRSGYAPACANEWVAGVCNKPRIKCGECRHQAFHAVTDRVIEDHLRGRYVVGVYPLLHDDTCWFLAADFDEADWREDVAAFVETCRTLGLAPSIERSRSGNGAHVWFFFADPIPARSARALGCFALTLTMERRHQLKLSSYDRLFPNQDTVPRGGFGNLIALPLQREAAEKRHTLFLDDRFDPLPNQWAYLAGAQRLTRSFVDEVVADAERRGSIIAVGMGDDVSERGEAKPWARTPTERVPLAGIPSLPTTLEVVIAQRLFIPIAGLPTPLIARLRRIASFQNPEFYQKQRLRLSTHATPRVITCAEDVDRYLALPRGCLDELRLLLGELGVALAVHDERVGGTPLDVVFAGELDPAQQQAVDAMATHDIGVLVAPPGAGKTVMAAALVARRARTTLVLVHRRPLVEQWVARLSAFLGVASRDIGQITSGKRRVTSRVDVATIQSLVRKGVVSDLVAGYGHVIVDECHHVAAVSMERVLSQVRATYVTGLTATPTRRDGLHPIVHMQLGPVRYLMKQAAIDAFSVARRVVVRDTPFPAVAGEPGIQELYAALGRCAERDTLICADVVAALGQGRSPIVLTERRDHLERLEERLATAAEHVVVLRGGRGARERANALRQLGTTPATETRLVLATGRYVGEGLDDARLDTLFLVMPIAWRGRVIQYVGRLHRRSATKREVLVYDYVDREVPVLVRMFGKRARGYRAMGYELDAEAAG